jgi:alkylation response protein AidB-like acyl-CoA dehydrogenase
MNWDDTPQQAAFREEVRTFISQQLPEAYRSLSRGAGMLNWYRHRKSDDQQLRQAAQDWAAALSERGWVAPHWPSEYGGAGLSPWEQFIFNEEMTRGNAPMVGGSGVIMLGPTLIVHGSEEQKREYLPRILSGEVAWAQGYSEPGAGSDLASLQTRAVRDGDEYVINGQKIWTSSAHFADALFALVRTDPDAPKHRGISFVLIDNIKTPGITVRPLIDAAWGHEVNETFFEDVRIPASNVVGEVNRGWYVGMTLLDFERSGISDSVGQRRDLGALLGAARDDARSVLGRSPALRGRLTDRALAIEVAYNFSLRVASIQAANMVPNYEASVAKMFASEQGQELHRVGVRAFGLYGQVWPGDPDAPLEGKHIEGYIRSIPSTIGGGSSEIQRSIIATRGLGLPRG